ncbi:MAG: DUF305 domain-containing protein [Gemmatimonadales bacterium]|nr:DUF305 domain-containing protein [Gemmatimonadales bacterium]
MTRSRARAFLPAIACILTACGSVSREPEQPAPATGDPADLAAIARARADSARHPYTQADVHFMSAMIGHHAQALVMAGWAPTHGASPAVRTLAERILNGQQDEIATMRLWLGDRGRPVPASPDSGMTAPAHGDQHAGHGQLMPGMLTGAQLRQLDAAKGPEFDRMFLASMIKHHRGAVTMVENLFGSYGAAQDETVFKFANDVSADQSTEIARMETMLAALSPGTPSP